MVRARCRWFVSGWEEGLAWAAAAAEMLNSSGMGGGVTYYCWELRDGRGGELPVTSSSRTVSLSASMPGRSKRIDLTPSTPLRAVATTGMVVVRNRCRVSAKPMPRLAGQTKGHAIVRCCRMETHDKRMQSALPGVLWWGCQH
jgi:hypothetical protein